MSASGRPADIGASAARWTDLQVLVVVAEGGPDEAALPTLFADRRAPVRLLGEGARLVPAHDVNALDAAVRPLLTSPRERADLAERGRARAAGWPTPDDTVAQVAAVYQELTGVAD